MSSGTGRTSSGGAPNDANGAANNADRPTARIDQHRRGAGRARARSSAPGAPGATGATGATVDRRLRTVITILCLLGIGIAAYLTYVHYAGLKVLCLSGGSCETVQSSNYAKLGGIPVALLGLAGYIAILLSLAVRGEAGRAAAFGIALIGCGFSLYLTYRELFTIKAICQWCVASAVLMTALAILTAVRVLRDDAHSRAPGLPYP